MSLFQKSGDMAARIFVRAGLSVSKFAAAILLALIKGAKFVLSDLAELVKLHLVKLVASLDTSGIFAC